MIYSLLTDTRSITRFLSPSSRISTLRGFSEIAQATSNLLRCSNLSTRFYLSQNQIPLHALLSPSMPNHRLMRSPISLSTHLRLINDPPHLPLLRLTQLHLSTRPILLQPLFPRRPRNRNQPLTRHPRQRNLRRRTPFLLGEFLNLPHNSFILVEILALELRRWNASIRNQNERKRGQIVPYLICENHSPKSRRENDSRRSRLTIRDRADCTQRTQHPVLWRCRLGRRSRAVFRTQSIQPVWHRFSQLSLSAGAFLILVIFLTLMRPP
jgi:hypothetical protein